MPLTVGRLGQTRALGGTRGILRREQRRAERDGNTALANQLGARIAEENIARGLRGDSNIGSADSDAREVQARRTLQRRQLGERARLAASPAPQELTPVQDGNLPTQQAEPERLTAQNIPTNPGIVRSPGSGPLAPTSQPSSSGTSPQAPQGFAQEALESRVSDAPAVAEESDLPPEQPTRESFVEGVPTDTAIARGRFDEGVRASLDQGELPDFDGPSFDREALGFTDDELRLRRSEVNKEFEARFGRDALQEALRKRIRLSEARRPIDGGLVRFARQSQLREIAAEDPFSQEGLDREEFFSQFDVRSSLGSADPISEDRLRRRAVDRQLKRIND